MVGEEAAGEIRSRRTVSPTFCESMLEQISFILILCFAFATVLAVAGDEQHLGGRAAIFGGFSYCKGFPRSCC
jgi:hypothetical protein